MHEICGVKLNKSFGDVAGPDEEDLEVSKRSAEALFIYGCRRDLRHWRSLLQNTISSPALLELRAACDMCRQKQCSGWALFNQGAVIKLTQFASVYQGAARRTWIWRSTPRWRGGMRPRRPRAVHEPSARGRAGAVARARGAVARAAGRPPARSRGPEERPRAGAVPRAGGAVARAAQAGAVARGGGAAMGCCSSRARRTTRGAEPWAGAVARAGGADKSGGPRAGGVTRAGEAATGRGGRAGRGPARAVGVSRARRAGDRKQA